MLKKYVIILIEVQFGREIRYPMDCEELAKSITKQTGSRISGSTLKRLFAFNKGTERPRLYTLDTIARYLGYPNWDHLDAANLTRDGGLAMLEAVDVATLKEGARVTVKYWPDRTLVLDFLGGSLFKVIETNSPELLPGDLLEINSFLKKHR